MTIFRYATVLLVIIVALAGCKRYLAPTPNLYLDNDLHPFADVSPELRTNTVDMLYVTDRLPEDDEKHASEIGVVYGYDRSTSLAFGSCVVEIGDDVPWDVLVEQSKVRKRDVKLALEMVSVTELGRFPESPPPLVMEDGVVEVAPQYLAARRAGELVLHDELRRRLAITPRKQAYVFIHGYKNELDDAAFRMTELWHFLGREGVPIIYSWPAGHPGLLHGYTHDRESSEFTIYHLKEFLRMLASCPELEDIHIISHSRGTDVAVTAVRELVIEADDGDEDPREALKFGRFVLAAPDIDAQVSDQRNASEHVFLFVDRLTVYVNEGDRALGIAEWLFSNPLRLGKLRPGQLTERQRQRIMIVRNGEIIDSRVRTDYTGHGYFLSNPATFSDVILVLRYHRLPGEEHGRPLTEIMSNYYILNDQYPQQAAPLPKGMSPKSQDSKQDEP